MNFENPEAARQAVHAEEIAEPQPAKPPRILHLVAEAPVDPWEQADKQPITKEMLEERTRVIERSYEGMDCN